VKTEKVETAIDGGGERRESEDEEGGEEKLRFSRPEWFAAAGTAWLLGRERSRFFFFFFFFSGETFAYGVKEATKDQIRQGTAARPRQRGTASCGAETLPDGYRGRVLDDEASSVSAGEGGAGQLLTIRAGAFLAEPADPDSWTKRRNQFVCTDRAVLIHARDVNSLKPGAAPSS